MDLGASAAWRPALQAIVGNAHIADGDWDEGSALIDEAVAAADSGAPLGRVSALLSRAQADNGSPDLARLSTMTEALLAAAESTGSAYWIIGARLQRAVTALRAGDRAGFERERSSLVPLAANNVTNPDVKRLAGTVALLDGRFADAERIALELLASTDPASAVSSNASSQIAAVWYWSGRDDALLGALEVFPGEQRPQRYLLDLVRVSNLARRGERDPAFDTLAADDFAALPWGWHRPGSLCHAGSAAAWLGDRERARILEPLLAPYAGQLLCAPSASLAFETACSAGTSAEVA